MKDAKEKEVKGGVGIQPLHDRVLVKEVSPDDRSKKTASGIIIPDTVSEDRGAKHGKVVAVGNGKVDDGERIPLEVKVGDDVLFEWGTKIKYQGEEYHVVTESSIIAIIK